MVLDLEDVVETYFISELHLLEHLMIDSSLVFRSPVITVARFGELQLVEQAELHEWPFPYPEISSFGSTAALTLTNRIR
jgi:hypothetical protein